MVGFSESERRILSYFVRGETVEFNGQSYRINRVGKPSCSSGEPKTDIYIALTHVDNEHDTIEIKISYKQSNADFLENKIKAERAEQIFGSEWQTIIRNSVEQIRDALNDRRLIYRLDAGRTEKGSITLGWKFELVNRGGGRLSNSIVLTNEQYKDVLSGNNLSDDKKNAYVDNERINNSGVANYILTGDNFNNANTVLENLQTIDDYIASHPEIYFACKALNYRSFSEKFDGDRPLVVQVEWQIQNNQLTPNLIFDRPLTYNGREVYQNLLNCLNQLNIKTTNDINSNNTDMSCVYG